MRNGYGKRTYALAALAGVLLLSLCGCRKNTGENLSEEKVRGQACEYLAGRYSAEFTILRCDTKSDSPGPIPVRGFHWELMVKSSAFPEDHFFVYYGKVKDDEGAWYWTDNYYSLIFRDEADSDIKSAAERFFGVNCLVESLWGVNAWPDRVGESSTFKDWLNAGGKCPTFMIYLEGRTPEEALCQEFSDSLLAEFPTIKYISFYGVTTDVFDEVSANSEALADLWNSHPEWRLGRISCSPAVQ